MQTLVAMLSASITLPSALSTRPSTKITQQVLPATMHSSARSSAPPAHMRLLPGVGLNPHAGRCCGAGCHRETSLMGVDDGNEHIPATTPGALAFGVTLDAT